MDDAAVLTPPEGADLVVKTDAIIGGVHFFLDDPAAAVARKALRVNLSDLAAKGADPAGFLLTLALPATIDDQWLSNFAKGLGEDADEYNCPLLGGDTDRTPGPITISITAFGFLPRGAMVRRHGARAGDRVVVTGTIGDAALGLHLRRDAQASARWGLEESARAHLLSRYLVPQPRSAIAAALRSHAAAAMDVSDGLAGDLGKLCAASGVSADIEIARVPLSPAARRALAAAPDLRETILAGGDDYEVLVAVAPAKLEAFAAQCANAGVSVTDIGCMTARVGPPRFLDGDGRAVMLKRVSFSHF